MHGETVKHFSTLHFFLVKISWGVKAAGAYGLLPSCSDCLEVWEPQPPGTLRAWTGFTFQLPLNLTFLNP